MPHVEVEQVWPREGDITIIGFTHELSKRPEAGWTLVLASREREGAETRYGVESMGERLVAAVPVAGLVGDEPLASEVWDVYLVGETGAGEGRLRVGRHLDDIEDKKRVMIFPYQRVEGAVPVTVRPYYTIYNNLSIRCRQVEEEATEREGRAATTPA